MEGRKSISELESELSSHISTDTTKVKENHATIKSYQQRLSSFYSYNNADQRAKRNQPILNRKAYSLEANLHRQRCSNTSNKNDKKDKSQNKLINNISQNSIVCHTDEFRSTKLCSLCHQPIHHPKKNIKGKVSPNYGAVTCDNPDCFCRKYGFVDRSRDLNTATNRIMIDIEQLASDPLAL
ncbi:uncharacterized protein BX664DRAFT_103246 [Halteromyces radiatus]|uniref:uncharacterized protein n=1 Tax=Halteromyces radiatus TaxID=101107 RepID=UPI002220B10B|nr:uncharacterized protein BX664DRAFT_103246 [Halteromyces radiatus]KAI8093237.1 hypothetical protein BX664DRAFT_103246 [Halteromyces radiatus]